MSAADWASQPNGKVFDAQNMHGTALPVFPQVRISPDYLPGGRKSLSGIAEHSLGLGVVLGVALTITFELASNQHYLWRLPFFIAVLCVFHFLEFDMTARYNPPDAKVSSFLLFNNGIAYNLANTAAVVEVLLRCWLTSDSSWPLGLFPESLSTALRGLPIPLSVSVGICLIVVGQSFRSLAMRTAGTSFNHIVQSNKKEDHVLVTAGVYKVSRHPAYFGFFWWGLGTQLVLGNTFCFLAYTAVLWKFFAHRVMHEEKHLISFFGRDYEDYRARTPVLIPFIA